MAGKLSGLGARLAKAVRQAEQKVEQGAARKAEKLGRAAARVVRDDLAPLARQAGDVFEAAGRAVAGAVAEGRKIVDDFAQPEGDPRLLPPPDLGAHTTLAQLSQVLDSATGTRATAGNQVQVYVDGEHALPAILQSLDSAQKSICYETYQFDGAGQTVDQVVDHLIAAKQRGVAVRVLADASGAREFLGRHNPELDRLRQAGVEVKVFNPFDNVDDVDVLRDHRKSIVVDGQQSFVGGMNTGDKYLGGPQVQGRLHDVFTRIQGPAVSQVLGDFLDSWRAAGGAAPTPAELTAPLAAGQSATPGSVPVRIVAHVPHQDANIRATYLALINHATKNIYVENSYPMSQDLAQALCAAARRGVEVQYIVGTHQGMLGEAARKNFARLVDAGVHVYLYPTPIHTKSLSVDGEVCTVGSSNVDNVALTRNREIISVVEDPAYTRAYDQALFQRDLQGDGRGHATVELKRPFSEPLWRRVADAVLTGVWPDSLE